MSQIISLVVFAAEISLLPSDAVEIEIWHQPALSAKYLVGTDTSLNIPLLGQISVKDVPLDSLQRLLVSEFQKYYGDLFININFYYRVNIFGEVENPGHYYLKSGDNLANLLAQAGGPTAQGSLGKIRILRQGAERTINFERILKSGKNLVDLNLRPGDVVIVPRRLIPALQEWSVLFTLGTFFLQVYNTYMTARQR